MSAEVLEGGLVRVEKLREPLVGARLVEAATAEAERQDEDVQLDGSRAEVHARLAPVNLALRSGRRLETSLSQLVGRYLDAQRPYEELHRLVAPRVAVLLAELLEQDPRRVAHLRRPPAEKVRAPGEQRVAALGAPIRLPAILPQAATHGLAVEIEAPCDLPDRHLLAGQPADLLPSILSDHPHLPGLLEPGGQGRDDSLVVNRFHDHPPRSGGWGDFDYHRWGEFRYR